MRRIAIALASTVSGLVMLFSYRTSTMGSGGRSPSALAAPGLAPSGSTGGTSSSGSSATSGTAAASAGASPPTTAAGGSTVTVNGTAVQTRWGTVQVQVQVRSGKIVEVAALALPDGNGRDLRINSRAVPILRSEVLAAQSAQIDTVSGATITSNGYISSLQAAIDAAHLGG